MDRIFAISTYHIIPVLQRRRNRLKTIAGLLKKFKISGMILILIQEENTKSPNSWIENERESPVVQSENARLSPGTEPAFTKRA